MGNFIICMRLFACALLCAAERRPQARVRARARVRRTKAEAWNDNAAVHCQRMWSQIKATRPPLSLSSLPAAFPDRRMKGEAWSFFFLTYFFLWLIVALPILEKCSASMQWEAVMEGLCAALLGRGPGGAGEVSLPAALLMDRVRLHCSLLMRAAKGHGHGWLTPPPLLRMVRKMPRDGC